MKFLALGAALVLLAAEPVSDALRPELVRLAREDQADREDVGDALKASDAGYMKRMSEHDAARTAKLKAIVAEHGWPTVALVGKDGVNAAWLLLQHTEDVAWQASLLPAVERAAAAGEVRQQDVATLTDRVLVRAGKPQRYGCSFSLREGKMVADPIEDLDHLDARRAAVGLPPMEEYVRVLADAYELPVEWPPKP
jgi:hypothetical protein